MKMTRRGVLATASAGLATTILGKKARAAAEFDFKLGVNTPESHPLTIRLVEAAKAAGAQSGGRLNITVFPNSQLGGDPAIGFHTLGDRAELSKFAREFHIGLRRE